MAHENCSPCMMSTPDLPEPRYMYLLLEAPMWKRFWTDRRFAPVAIAGIRPRYMIQKGNGHRNELPIMGSAVTPHLT